MRNIIYFLIGSLSLVLAAYSFRNDKKRYIEEKKYGRLRFLVYLLESIGGGLFNGFVLFLSVGILFILLGIMN